MMLNSIKIKKIKIRKKKILMMIIIKETECLKRRVLHADYGCLKDCSFSICNSSNVFTKAVIFWGFSRIHCCIGVKIVVLLTLLFVSKRIHLSSLQSVNIVFLCTFCKASKAWINIEVPIWIKSFGNWI